MVNDIILNKTQVIKRYLKRIHEEYDNNPGNLDNYTKQIPSFLTFKGPVRPPLTWLCILWQKKI